MAEETVADISAPEAPRSGERAGRGIAIRRWEPPRWSAWVAVAVVVVANIIVVWDSTGLIYQADEAGMIFNAALFARPENPVVLLGSSYMPGLAILIAPLWLLTDDAATVYRAAIFVNAAIGVATLWPMSRVARKFGASRNGSIVLASIVAVNSAVLLQSNYLLAENLLHFAVMLTAWAVIVQFRNPSFRQASLVGASSGLMFLVHGRTLPLLIVVAIAFVIMLFKRPADAIAGGGLLGTIAGTSYVLLLWIQDQNYLAADRAAQQLSLLSGGSPVSLVAVGAAQVWVQSLMWWGIAGLGVLVLLVRARRGRFARESLWLLAAGGAAAVFVLFTLSGDPASYAESPRIDFLIYSRYLDMVSPFFALVGIAALAARASRLLRALALGVVALSGALFLVVAVPLMPSEGRWEGAHTPALAPYLGSEYAVTMTGGDWAVVVMVSICLTMAAGALASRSALGVVVIGFGFLGTSLFADAAVLKDHEALYRTMPGSLHALEGVDEAASLGLDLSVEAIASVFNQMEFWVYPREISAFSSERGDTPRSELVMTGRGVTGPAEQGAWPLNGSLVGETIIWVFPGDLRDALDAEGRVAHPNDE